MSAIDRPVLPPPGPTAPLETFLHDSVGGVTALQRAAGAWASYRKGPVQAVFGLGPEANRLLLFSSPELFHISSGVPGPRRSAQRSFGSGMFGLNGPAHLGQRRLLMPSFRKGAVEGRRDEVVAAVEALLADWRPGQVRDLAADMKALSLRLTSGMLFGLADPSLADAVAPAFDDWLDLDHAVSFAGMLPIEGPPDGYARLLAAAEALGARLRALLDHRRAGPPGDDLLGLLLAQQAAGAMSDVEVIGQTHALFNAAYHTTKSALTWTLFLLCQHPAVAVALVQELEEGLGGAAPTAAGLDRLGLLDRVVKEALRLLPPVVYYARLCTAPVTFGPFRAPKGTLFVGSIYASHHLAESFPEPQKFLPERWRTMGPCPHAYVPFGGGARLCLGTPLALLIVKVTVALIVQRYRLTVVSGSRIDRHATLTLRPRGAVPVAVCRQDRQYTTSAVVGDIHDMVELPRTETAAAA
jgi:cytochrome P450